MMNNNGCNPRRIDFIANGSQVSENVYAIDNSGGVWSAMFFKLDETKTVVGKRYKFYVKVHNRILQQGYVLDYPTRDWGILNGYCNLNNVKTIEVGETFSFECTLLKNSGIFISFQFSPAGAGSRLEVECWYEESEK